MCRPGALGAENRLCCRCSTSLVDAKRNLTNELTESSTHPFLSENAIRVLREGYLHCDNAGDVVETPDGMLE